MWRCFSCLLACAYSLESGGGFLDVYTSRQNDMEFVVMFCKDTNFGPSITVLKSVGLCTDL